MKYALPDCRDVADPFYLTPEQRRELILLIAEQGEAGIEEFVRRHQADDSAIARKIAKLRAKLLEEAAEVRRRLHSQFDEKRMEQERRARHILDQLRAEEERLKEHERELRARLPSAVEAHLRSLPVIELALQPPRRLGWFARLRNWARRWLARVWHAILGLFGLRPPAPRAKAIVIGVPGLGGPGIEVPLDLERALAQNPDLRRRIRSGLGASWGVRARRLWRILLGLENYAEVAREIMQQEAKRAAEEHVRELEADKRRLEEELARRREEEERVRKEVEQEVERLNRAEEEERRRLEERLAVKPESDAVEIVAAELEAAALVERLEGKLHITGRFLESLAGLVYAEEAKGVGPTSESPLGTSIEGEGLLERTPLLSYYETAHMDTVGSLVQARTRHPHVRHLLEEDVLVFRERRSSLTHVVIILDKSLSMAENRRMEAAKRAALALYWGTKLRSPLNQIDFVLMDTSVHRATLSQCWEAQPSGFTNTGRALELARALFLQSRATRKVLFLVTDGLPEALTIEGKDTAGRPEEALAYAVRQAERLRHVKDLAFSMVLLEPKDPLFVQAAEKLAQKGRGRVVKVTPAELTRSLLVELREESLAAAV